MRKKPDKDLLFSLWHTSSANWCSFSAVDQHCPDDVSGITLADT